MSRQREIDASRQRLKEKIGIVREKNSRMI
jgi:hypothetical protein